MDGPDYVVKIRIEQGYPFRSLIESLKHITESVTWFFSQEKFIISDVSESSSTGVRILSGAEFPKAGMIDYQFYHDKVITEEEEFWVLSTNAGGLRDQMKSISRGQKMEIIVQRDSRFLIRPYDERGNKDYVNTITGVVPNDPSLVVFSHPIPEDLPTCKYSTSDLQKLCSGFKVGGKTDSHILFKLSAGNDGILVQHCDTKRGGRIQQIGNYTHKVDQGGGISELLSDITFESPSEAAADITLTFQGHDSSSNYSAKVPMIILKALSKVSTISAQSVVRFYMKEGVPLKFLIPISTLGYWRLYLD